MEQVPSSSSFSSVPQSLVLEPRLVLANHRRLGTTCLSPFFVSTSPTLWKEQLAANLSTSTSLDSWDDESSSITRCHYTSAAAFPITLWITPITCGWPTWHGKHLVFHRSKFCLWRGKQHDTGEGNRDKKAISARKRPGSDRHSDSRRKIQTFLIFSFPHYDGDPSRFFSIHLDRSGRPQVPLNSPGFNNCLALAVTSFEKGLGGAELSNVAVFIEHISEEKKKRKN